jgi:hypothetical protein
VIIGVLWGRKVYRLIITRLLAAFMLIVGGSLVTSAALAGQPETLSMSFRLDVTEDGSWFTKTMREMTSKQGKLAVKAACVVFGYDCSSEVEAAAAILRSVYVDQHRQDGETHHFIVRAPEGYELCKVKVDWAHASLDSQSSWTARIHRRDEWNGLGMAVTVPIGRKEGHSAKGDVDLMFIPYGTAEARGCFPAQIMWACQGNNCDEFYPDARK